MAFNPAIKLIFALTCAVFVESSPNKFVPSVETNPFIVGGVDVTIEEYPFSVVCYLNNQFSCGGSILNENWILTAAHCTCHSIQWGVTVRNSNGPNIFRVVENIRYPGYISYTRDDVQLLRLDKNITFGPNAQPVKLPNVGWEVQGDSYTVPSAVLGWGRDENGITPVTLQIGNYFVVNNTYCSKLHEDVGLKVYDFNCCNGVKGGGVADCNGDSGGPIVTWIGNQIVQYGVVSWSVKPCLNPTYPAVGTKTSHYAKWISETTGISLEQLTV